MAPTPTQKRLALAIHSFLSDSLKDGTLSPEDKDSVEVAQSCIADSFHVDPSDAAAKTDALGGQSLLSIYSVYEKLKSSKAAPSTPAPNASSSTSTPASPEKKAEAEALKGKGNASMASKSYPDAITHYTSALALSPGNAIYLSNRAAAYSASHQHSLAEADARAAVASDPSYTKAWSRLGLALYAQGDAKGSMDAYAKGIEAEGNGGSDAMKKGYETAKRKVESGDTAMDTADDESSSPRGAPGAGGAGGMPDLSGLASMLGGGGGGGGAGGGPDLSSIMSNPMFASMAQNLMSNPDMMNNLMSNPRLRDMASQFGGGAGGAGAQGGRGGGGGGGGMPDLGALMSDPSIAEMAKNLMGGGAGGAGRGTGGAPPS